MEKKFQEKREVRVMKEVKKPSVVPVQVPGNEGGPPKTPIIIVNCGAADFVDVLHPSLPFFEHFLGGGRLKSRFYQPELQIQSPFFR